METKMEKNMDRVKFFRRRQFVLGPQYLDYEGWKQLKVKRNYMLTIHPDLQTTVTEQTENKAFLLGYAIDPYQPDLTEEDILQRFVSNVRSVTDVVSQLEKLSGRFVLIVTCREGLWLFHDAVALRQVQYCVDKSGSIWCASQAETLAERLGFEHDEEVLDYRNIPAYQKSRNEFWIMNDRTPYREIKNLLPNHYLDLLQAKALRYWPSEGCIGTLSVDESIKLSTPVLQNSIKTATQRFNLWMGISAGGDSRKTLAACKDIKNRMAFFTNKPLQTSMVKNDAEIPARLLPRLGLKHSNLGLQIMSPKFKEYYNCSATWARDSRGNIAYTLLNHFGPEVTVLNSNISEVDQRIYWLPKSKINGENLALLSGLNHPFVIEEFQKWIDGAQRACKVSNMNILDLFFLEQRMGRWATAAFSEYDIVHETFNPYNNRHLHGLMLAVNERHRKNRRWDVIIKHIKYMWPEVLIEPINPPDQIPDKIQQFIRRFIIHKTVTPWIPVYEYMRYLKLKRHFKASGESEQVR
jgi:hypothetical protein